MKNTIFLPALLLCLFSASCQRPVAYFQRTPHAASRLPVQEPVSLSDTPAKQPDSLFVARSIDSVVLASKLVATLKNASADTRIERRMNRAESMLPAVVQLDKQPEPKPKPKQELRLGNRIRDSLGMPLRKELNWWQRISWKLKASVIVILVAVVFAILNITVLAIIFGILGAFLLITGLKKSMKVRRPWF